MNERTNKRTVVASVVVLQSAECPAKAFTGVRPKGLHTTSTQSRDRDEGGGEKNTPFCCEIPLSGCFVHEASILKCRSDSYNTFELGFSPGMLGNRAGSSTKELEYPRRDRIPMVHYRFSGVKKLQGGAL